MITVPEMEYDMLENVEGIIFDLDGTIVDSMGVWRAVDEEFLGRRGITLPEGLNKELESMEFTETARYFKRNFSLPETVEEIIGEWMEMVLEQYRDKVLLKPGLKGFLEYAQGKGIRMGVASSNHVDLVRAALDGHGIGSFFSVIVTCSEVERAKPEPDVYLEAARRLKIPAERCLVFEDIPVGIRAGKSAGMRTCAIQDDYSQEQDEEKRRLADHYIGSYTQVLDGTYEVLQNRR